MLPLTLLEISCLFSITSLCYITRLLLHHKAAEKNFWKGTWKKLDRTKNIRNEKPIFWQDVPKLSQMLPLMLEISCLPSIRRLLLQEVAAEKTSEKTRDTTEYNKQYNRGISRTCISLQVPDTENFLFAQQELLLSLFL